MKHILIVEDEPFLLASMVKFMDALENVRTRGCANLTDALAAIGEQAPDLVFSDINLPDGSGLALIDALDRRGLQIPLIFVSAFISDYRGRIPPDSRIMVLEKPISMKRLRQIAREKLGESARTYVFKLSDYLQIAAMGNHTVCLDRGMGQKITVVDGELWSAFDAIGEGEAAFKRIVASAEVHGNNTGLVCRQITESEIGARNIQGGLDNLLLEAVIEEEEQIHQNGTARDPAALDFDSLLDQGVEKLLGKAYGDALAIFEQLARLDPEHRIVRTNIQRLNELGYSSGREP